MSVIIRTNIMMGSKYIKDATALPEDVISGKVFYNNGGRQIGTNEWVVKDYNVPVDFTENTYTTPPGFCYEYNMVFKAIKPLNQEIYKTYVYGNIYLLPSIKYMDGITVNGIYNPFKQTFIDYD